MGITFGMYSEFFTGASQMNLKLITLKLRANAFTLSSETEEDLGIIFDPLLSMANHSCRPNAFVVVSARTVTIRCLRPINEGEEIVISYIGVFSKG